MASVSHFAGVPASDLLRSSTCVRGIPLRALGRSRIGLSKRRDFSISAKIRKTKKHDHPWPDNPDPNVKGGVLTHLSHFKPLKEKPKPVTLEFEKPLVDIEKKINDIQKMAKDTGMDFGDQILSLENKYQKARKDLYSNLTPIQRVNIARHPNRPTFLDHVFNITEKFVELHGDRAGYDDPAVVTGIGTIDGQRYMFMGHQKGRNTKENIQRNFGMPTPHGYRKALRMMYYADHHGFPIVTFIDTPGAFADLKSEELGQGEAIAHNLRTMFGLKVPIISIVIGEGGSGGALAIGCGNKLLMLQNAVFYVASPEACAAILWKSAKASPMAAEKLKITATELCKLGIADGVIPEPLGGAHMDPAFTSQQIKMAINEAMAELTQMDTPELLKHRMLKFRKIGSFQEGIPIEPRRKINMKKKEEPIVVNQHLDLANEVEKLKQQVAKAVESSSQPPISSLNETIAKLEKEINLEFSKAIKSMGFEEKFAALRKEFAAGNSGKLLDQSLQKKIDKLKSEFDQSLPKAPNYEALKSKFELMRELSEAKSMALSPPHQEKIAQKLKEVKERPEIKEKLAALKSEIQNSGASNMEDLDMALRAEYEKLKSEIQSELSDLLLEEFTTPEIKTKIESFNEEIEKKIESVVESSDLKGKIQQLKIEIARAGKKPDPSAQKRIEALQNQIRQSLASALESSTSLQEEHEKLQEEIAECLESSSEGLDEPLETEDSEELREKVNVGTNSSFA